MGEEAPRRATVEELRHRANIAEVGRKAALSRQVPDALRVVLREAQFHAMRAKMAWTQEEDRQSASALVYAITPLLERGEEQDDG